MAIRTRRIIAAAAIALSGLGILGAVTASGTASAAPAPAVLFHA